MERGHSRMADFEVVQVVGDDANHRPAGGQGGIGHDPHQPDLAAAKNEPDAGCGEQRSQLRGRLPIAVFMANVGAAVNT